MEWKSEMDGMPRGRVSFMSTHPCTVYEADNEDGDNQNLVCVFDGQVRVILRKKFIKVLTEGEFWWLSRSVDQTQPKTDDRKFTSLDRPAPLSPEMRAIHELEKRNEIAREAMISNMERTINERLQRLHASEGKNSATGKVSAQETQASRQVSKPSEKSVAKQKRGADQQPSEHFEDGSGVDGNELLPSRDEDVRAE